MTRGWLWLATFLALAGANAAAEPSSSEIVIHARALPISHVSLAAPNIRVSGAWRLSSDDPRLGGISGLLARDGELLMLSDAGALIRLRDDFGNSAQASIAALPTACMVEGRADSESLTLSPDGLALRVGLERNHGLCSFSLARPEAAKRHIPSAIAAWSRNRGAEAMASLPGHGTTIIGEGRVSGGYYPLLWYAVDPAAGGVVTSMRYQAPAGFKPADAAFLPDGRMLVVNRRFAMPDMRATVLTIGGSLIPREGEVTSGQELLRIERGPLAANYEGLAVQPRLGGATIWLISDDNFSNRSGTMIVRLELDEAAPTALATSSGTNANSAR